MQICQDDSLAIAVNRLPAPDLVKVLELLVARATVYNDKASIMAKESVEPIQRAIMTKIAAHAQGQLVGLTRALNLVRGTWQDDNDILDVIQDLNCFSTKSTG